MKAVSIPQDGQAWLERQYVESKVLQGNRAGEDHRRILTVYMPKEAHDKSRKFPVLYCLAPWTSAGRSQFDWQSFRESLFDRLNRLISEKKIPACIVVSPDLYTSFGGSQYINSDYFGNHGDHIVNELIPYIENNFPVLKGPQYRGVFGRSSGGFGALRLAMAYPDTFGSVACHSGDMGFDAVYRRDLIDMCNGLRRYDGDVQAFLKDCRTANKISGSQVHLLMLLGMCGTYSPDLHNPDGFEIPIDLRTGVVDEEVWQRWVSHDPVKLLDDPRNLESLRKLSCLYVECGNRDQYNLHYGARQFVDKLSEKDVKHHYFEFDDNHSGTSYRYDISLPMMLDAMPAH